MTVDIDEIEFFRDTASFEFGGEVLLAVGDLHLGLERSLQDSGYTIPLGEEETIESKLRDSLYQADPDVVVLNGDIHHKFGELGPIGKTIKRLGDIVENSGAEVVYVEGNHDTMLDKVVETRDWYLFKPTESDVTVCCLHGDDMPVDLPDADLYVVGHDHPYVKIQMDKQPCYLYGDFDESRVLVTPPFNPFCSGTVVNGMDSGDFMSPFIRGDFGRFRLVIEKEDGDVLEFPEIRGFRNMLS
ncbi:MAG: metallophosphoesterase [Halobacteria archaeon]